jgi:dipeptidyl aminopeptidase/acylaminoacyl peptidase
MAEALKENYRYVELPLGEYWLSRETDRLDVFRERESFLKAYFD